MKETLEILEIVTDEEVTNTRIEKIIEEIKGEENSSFGKLLLLDYLKARKTEIVIEKMTYSDKKKEINRVFTEYMNYLSSIQELYKNKEIFIGDRLYTLIEKSINSQHITREEKVYLSEEKDRLKDSIIYQFDMNKILLYISVSLIKRIEIIKIEKNILDLTGDCLGESASDGVEKRPLYINTIKNTDHPIRITGRTTTKDIQDMLTPSNSYSLSIEEYGERVLKLMEGQTEPETAAENEEDSEILNELTVENEKERKKQESNESFYGDGNRMGRK